jgi:hypothetical protein
LTVLPNALLLLHVQVAVMEVVVVTEVEVAADTAVVEVVADTAVVVDTVTNSMQSRSYNDCYPFLLYYLSVFYPLSLLFVQQLLFRVSVFEKFS